jgi:GNAT superfamily N-acetyltransferase
MGREVGTSIPDLARLRIEVFRGFPYLYDGTVDYERKYLQTYARAPSSLFVLVTHADRVVGASTAVSLVEAEPIFRAPFDEVGIAAERVLYFGESVLERSYRGLGIGHRFFDAREAHAARLGHDVTAFCAVERSLNHPACPAGYRPLDEFWTARGYRRMDAMRIMYGWRDVGEPEETAKPMVFWVRGV